MANCADSTARWAFSIRRRKYYVVEVTCPASNDTATSTAVMKAALLRWISFRHI